jgi:two-component sensor histidine kinase
LKVTVSLKKIGNKIELMVRDNGPGIQNEKLENSNSLGFVLIDSLCEQLGGDSSKTNDDGFVYKMVF